MGAQGRAVNDLGQIAGAALIGNGFLHTFIYSGGPQSGVTLTSATGINDSDQICAIGQNASTPGVILGYLLTPVK